MWSELHIFAKERIDGDEIFINALKQKLVKVYTILGAEFFEMRLTRNLLLYLMEN